MPSVIHVLGLAVFTAITVGTVAIYYALNGGDQLQHNPLERRRRRSNQFQPAIQPGVDRMNVQNERDNSNACQICTRSIQNAEYDLTVLPCNHNFHCRCISDHFHRTATHETMQSTCPTCRASYSIANIM